MPTDAPKPVPGASSVAESFAEQLRQVAGARGREQRTRAIDELAEIAFRSQSQVAFLTRLTNEDVHGCRLALEIALRAPLPLAEACVPLLVPLLGDARYPTPLRLNVGIQLLRSLDAESRQVDRVLRGLLDELTPARTLERLRFLIHHLPDHEALQRQLARREEQAALACPRCGIRMQRAQLIVHLWQEHRLLMDGSRAREPWKMIEDWLTDYARTGRRELLDRSSELAQQLDPAGGLTRIHRLLLAAGLTDDEARDNLTSQVEGGRSSLCPHCYALVPPPHAALPEPMNVSHGRLAGNGCTVEVSDDYLFTHLYSATPKEVIHDGPEPGRGLTHRGQTMAFVGPIVAIAFALSILLSAPSVPPLAPVALTLLAGLLVYVRIHLKHGESGDPGQRAIDHAWEYLTPKMHRPKFSSRDADFVARLSVTSIGKGAPELREQSLERLLKLTRTQVADGKRPSGDLASLRCLEIDDAFRLGQDPVPILTADLSAGLAGEVPLVYCEQLLDAWPEETRATGQRARLRVLLCEKAFDLGMQPADLLQLGRVSPAFGRVIRLSSERELHSLKYIHDHRDDRPWQKQGSASAVFELARYPSLGRQYLSDHPDLLLFQPMSVGDRGRDVSAPILICASGVYYRELAITNLRVQIAVKQTAGRFRITVGNNSIALDDEPLVLIRRLQGWVRFLFQELLPQAGRDPAMPESDRLRALLTQKALTCPECGNSFLPMRGEVGMTTEESRAGSV